MNARVLALVIACFAGASAAAQGVDDARARAFRELRAAEMRDDSGALPAAEAMAPGSETAERAAIARAAIELRGKARNAADVRAAEDAIAVRRTALARTLESTAPDLARELLLETAEDLLLRRIVADGSDAMVAVGLPTSAERAGVRETLDRVEALLASPALAEALGPRAALATDPIAFRAHFLAGITAGLRADLGRCEGRDTAGLRTTAATLLDRAAQSELPAPAEIAAILALARARATSDPASRAPLLEDGAKSQDPTRAFVARVEQWRDNAARAPFPEPTGGLDILATAAELRQCAPAEIPTAVERAFRNAAAKGGAARTRRLAAALAQRIDARIRESAATADASSALVALVAIADEDRAFLRARLDALVPAVKDTAISPWLAVPLARELQAAGRTADAVRTLIAFVESTASPADSAEDAREAIEIALELARSEAQRDGSGEVLLDSVLAAATMRLADDPRRVDWLLERVDLALFPTWNRANADRAAEFLLSVPTDAEHRAARDIRAVEIEGFRAGSDSDAALAAMRRAEIMGATIPRAETELSARAETLRAQMLLVAARPAEALACATLAIRERGIRDRTARRAADAWLRAAVAEDEPIAPPAELLALAARNPAISEAALPVVGQLATAVEEALLRGDLAAARKLTDGRLTPLLRVAEASPSTSSAIVARASVLAELAADRAAEAFSRADRAAKRWPSDRALLWLRAECARRDAGGGEAARTRAFALFRELSPLATKSRDEFWWRAQLAQLEMLSDDPSQREQVLARINRLSALDNSMGSALLSRRFEELRTRCARPADGATR